MARGSRSVRRFPVSVGAAVGLVVIVALVVLAIGIGPIRIEPGETVRVVLHEVFGVGEARASLETTVVMNLRMPRVLFGALAGAALAVSGAALQGLFHNPLADPGIIGVSGGASTGAVAAIVLLPSVGTVAFAWLVPASAFAGGALATVLIYLLARPSATSGTARLLLVGVAVGAAFAAITGFLTYIADDDELESVVFWQMGSLGGITWTKLALVAPPIALGIVVLLAMNRSLDLLALGERDARHLGLDIVRTRAVVIALAALLTGATVAFAGTIGFIGLVVPHIVRMAFGPAHRAVVPMSAIVGAILIVVADTASRTVAPPSEVPIGLFTAALGAPFFLWLVMRSKEVRA
ncbi:FecCD family ABC transporter permease [Microbacterium indicum]|uniref:FecCD family ABC transporter permease n=1 Tax=Microbacterium indicum TaxID=358100 RepID=UPI000429ABD4|nr:iron ABC transporter permease [Microbacterium indicum]